MNAGASGKIQDPAVTGPPAIRDAASLVITKYDRASNSLSVLMGCRHPANAFMPNKYVFPGGRFDTSDTDVDAAGTLPARDLELLSASVDGGKPRHELAALALTAIRETFEETGVVIGAGGEPPQVKTSSPVWQHFFATGHRPNPAVLRFFARAITPPGRARRYDTRFFWVDVQHIARTLRQQDGELADVGWITIADARQKDLAGITRRVLDDIETCRGNAPAPDLDGHAVPFYFERDNKPCRVLLSHHDGLA